MSVSRPVGRYRYADLSEPAGGHGATRRRLRHSSSCHQRRGLGPAERETNPRTTRTTRKVRTVHQANGDHAPVRVNVGEEESGNRRGPPGRNRPQESTCRQNPTILLSANVRHPKPPTGHHQHPRGRRKLFVGTHLLEPRPNKGWRRFQSHDTNRRPPPPRGVRPAHLIATIRWDTAWAHYAIVVDCRQSAQRSCGWAAIRFPTCDTGSNRTARRQRLRSPPAPRLDSP
jgi:hypothetical protein